MMITPSHTIDTSGRMWVERITVWAPASDLMSCADADDLLGIEADRRLVEDQHLGIGDERLGEAHALPVALRQPPDQPLAHVGNLAPLQHLADAAPAARCARAP